MLTLVPLTPQPPHSTLGPILLRGAVPAVLNWRSHAALHQGQRGGGMHQAAAAAAQPHPSQQPLPGQAAEPTRPSEQARSSAQGEPGALYDTAADFGGASPASELDPGGQGLDRNEFSPLSLLWDSPAPTPRQKESLRKTSFWQLSPIKAAQQLHPVFAPASGPPSAPCEQQQQQHEPEVHTPAAQPPAQQGLQLTPPLQPPETPLQVSFFFFAFKDGAERVSSLD